MSIRSAALLVVLCAAAGISWSQEAALSMGDGEQNWIRTEGALRAGSTLTFPAAQIDGSGWLVLHPFRDGKPVGDIVAGYAPLAAGSNEDIAVQVDPAPQTGDRYIVMLHSDANSNGVFDFVFINEREVVDRAVFEGSTMIGYVYAVPAAD